MQFFILLHNESNHIVTTGAPFTTPGSSLRRSFDLVFKRNHRFSGLHLRASADQPQLGTTSSNSSANFGNTSNPWVRPSTVSRLIAICYFLVPQCCSMAFYTKPKPFSQKRVNCSLWVRVTSPS